MEQENKTIEKSQDCGCGPYPEVMAALVAERDALDVRLERHVRRTVAGREGEVLQVHPLGGWYVALWQGYPEPHRVVRVHCRDADGGRFSVLREYRVPLSAGSPRRTVLDYLE
jgi:hypothetical protein